MYGKIFASLYQGTLRGKAAEILVFTNMIACCDKDGEVDKHPRAIADEVGLPIDQVAAAITTLESPDPESRSRAHNGARIVRISTERTWGWMIVNYAKYRAIRNEDDRREQNREAVRRHRANKISVTNVMDVSHGKPEKAQADAEALSNKHKDNMGDESPVDDGFDDFWDAYGKKTGKSLALKAWKRLSVSDRQAAMDGVPAYLVVKPDPQYRKDPERYLKHRVWEDEQPASTMPVCPHPPGSFESMNWWVQNHPEMIKES